MAVETKYRDISTLPTGNELTIDVQKEGSIVTVVFKELGESGEGDEVTVGTIPKAIPLLIRARVNRELVILDGAKVLFRSENGGDEWESVS